MRIKKVSQTTPVQAHLTNAYSESTQDGYSADYLNGKLETEVINVSSYINSDVVSNITRAYFFKVGNIIKVNIVVTTLKAGNILTNVPYTPAGSIQELSGIGYGNHLIYRTYINNSGVILTEAPASALLIITGTFVI